MLGRCLINAVVLVVCLLAPATALGVDGEEEEGAGHVFSVAASHGYRLTVLASAAKDDGHGQVAIALLDKGWHNVAYYRAKGFVTDSRVKASFGTLGRVDLDLRPNNGREGQFVANAPCNGTRESYEKATYRGVLEFHGEEGFAAVSASRIAASPEAFVDLICVNHFEIHAKGLEPGAIGAGLRAEMEKPKRARVEFSVTKNQPNGRALVRVRTAERRHGLLIRRGVELLLGPTAFEYDDALSTATVAPPAPFSGSAVYRRDAAPAKRWSGDLSVDLPGRADVSLTRPDLEVTLDPAMWSLEGPELE